MKLINADEAIKAIHNIANKQNKISCLVVALKCESAVKQISSAEAVTTVHGKWIKQKCQGDYGLCSECGCRIPWIPQNYKYCPECGARMKDIDYER